MGTRPPEPVVFFVDRSLGSIEVPAALRAAGADVEIHDDYFDQDTSDATWLADVGKRGWVVLSRDERIRRHPHELDALTAAGVAAFLLTSAGITGAEMGAILAHAVPRMRSLAQKRVRPFVATISRSGNITFRVGGARRGGVRKKQK